MPHLFWTSKNSATAKAMWAAGDTAAAIAMAIGTTRNAVLGKASRGHWPRPLPG
jgi:hypothetical protein